MAPPALALMEQSLAAITAITQSRPATHAQQMALSNLTTEKAAQGEKTNAQIARNAQSGCLG